MIQKTVKITNKGMISIPAFIRKKKNIKDGDYILVREEKNGVITLNPIETVESIRKKALTVKEFKKIIIESKKEDMELER